MEKKIKWKRCKGDQTRWDCPFASGISCRDRLCPICGWFPPEHERRIRQLRKFGHVTIKTREDVDPDWDDQRESGLLAYD